MAKISLSRILTYPIKSLAGYESEHAEVCPRGLQYDRRWMLVDEQGRFMTQRKLPEMTMLKASVRGDKLHVEDRRGNARALELALGARHGREIEVEIWDDKLQADLVSEEADAWFSQRLDTRCRLVYMPEETERLVDLRYALSGETVSFADGFPVLAIGTASIAQLDSKLPFEVNPLRFRPNLIFETSVPHEEDDWGEMLVGNVRLFAAKPCSRCAMPTIDLESSEKQPLLNHRLAEYRLRDDKLLFGMNLLVIETGSLSIGDRLVLLAK